MAAMLYTTMTQLTRARSSPSSLVPLASPCLPSSVVRATTMEKCWTGHCAAANGHFNPLSNFSVNRSRAFRPSQGNGHEPRRQLQVAAIFGKKKTPVAVKPTVVPDSDYRLPVVLLSAAGAFVYSDNLFAAVPVGLLGLLLLVQATRVKFVFGNDALELKIGEDLKDSGDNAFVGGENSWKYSSFTNWEFWFPNFPILVYFKESQTKPEGQIHFFPIICNGKQIYNLMVERCGPSQNSGPK